MKAHDSDIASDAITISHRSKGLATLKRGTYI